jgi:hypothetical protein
MTAEKPEETLRIIDSMLGVSQYQDSTSVERLESLISDYKEIGKILWTPDNKHLTVLGKVERAIEEMNELREENERLRNGV